MYKVRLKEKIRKELSKNIFTNILNDMLELNALKFQLFTNLLINEIINLLIISPLKLDHRC